MFDPQVDDEFCSYFANNFGVLVVSIDYHKAPRNPFPGPVEDIAAIVSAVLSDDSLPIDHDKIAIGGFSAGGNLSLAISQKPELHKLIKAAVCFYAPLDFGTTAAQKLAGRPRPDKPDMLAPFLQTFDDAYVPEGTDVHNPMLSPMYAPRKSLPEWLYVICGEEDCLCLEDRAFAERAAGIERPDPKLPHPVHEINEDSWEVGPVKWELVRGMAHNFTHLKKRKPDEEKERLKVSHDIYARLFEWLQAGPWA